MEHKPYVPTRLSVCSRFMLLPRSLATPVRTIRTGFPAAASDPKRVPRFRRPPAGCLPHMPMSERRPLVYFWRLPVNTVDLDIG
jgi:hypothetical protein